ncbi:hypothetical protein NPX13_g7850 [Xylaria arbuscula]|uniref:Uncharacterized protein n=1 Tax=Xylaria arbuscula TaxID=114810 RepID=A0A9W8N9U3_9PEZI|nr:hypothetical protein NPX13_g7850 [Xylaria arbuscula]
MVMEQKPRALGYIKVTAALGKKFPAFLAQTARKFGDGMGQAFRKEVNLVSKKDRRGRDSPVLGENRGLEPGKTRKHDRK